MVRKFSLLLLALSSSGCSDYMRDYNQKIAQKNIAAAVVNTTQKNWAGARESWAETIKNLNKAQATDAQKAVPYYEYGRALGVTCRFTEAEEYLKQSVELDRRTNGPFYMGYVELGRLNLDQRKYVPAAWYYHYAITEMDRIGLSRKSPASYSDTIMEYSTVLSNVGKNVNAQKLIQYAGVVKGNNPYSKAVTDRTPYGTQCSN